LTLIKQLFSNSLSATRFAASNLDSNEAEPPPQNPPYFHLMQQLMLHWQQNYTLLQQMIAQATLQTPPLSWPQILHNWIPQAEIAFTQLLATESFQQAYGDCINTWLRDHMTGTTASDLA